MQTGWVFNIQKYSLHDGPGIRTTVFLKGCPLACAWCHNPESIARGKQVAFVETRCIHCGQCDTVCSWPTRQRDAKRPGSQDLGPVPKTAISPDYPARHRCVGCERCVSVCPTGARQCLGTEMAVPAVMAAVLKDRIFYDESNGGVTFSGGEPLMQPAFVKALLTACRSQGIHSAIDTCGFGNQNHLLDFAESTDLFLYDLKFMDDTLHRRFCGQSVHPILENLQALNRIHHNLWIRVPVIPSVNDSTENMSALARHVAALDGVRQINLLPYHKTGRQKHRTLGRIYTLEHVQPPSAEQMNAVAAIFRSFGLTIHIGGFQVHA